MPSNETGHLIGRIPISRPIREFITKATSEIDGHRPHPLIPFDLQVNSSLEVLASTLPKLEVLGVNLLVIEVKELKFDIYF